MKAAVYRRYGPPDVLAIEEVDRPVPKDNEVLVRVHATTVCAADWRFRKANPSVVRLFNGLRAPNRIRILGMEFAGTVEAVGHSVTRLRAGDEVFGLSLRFGGHAEYVCLPDSDILSKKPASMSFEEAAAVLFGGVTALNFLRKAGIQAGQRILVYGASGSVGVFTVQLARHFGAHVTAVCSTANLDLVKSLGADDIIDYTKEDFSARDGLYDIVFDTVDKTGFSRALKVLKPGGAYVQVGLSGGTWAMIASTLRGLWVSATTSVKIRGGVARGDNQEVPAFLRDLIEAGKLKTVIDRRYSLAQIADAHRHAEAGHKKGHVVVRIHEA